MTNEKELSRRRLMRSHYDRIVDAFHEGKHLERNLFSTEHGAMPDRPLIRVAEWHASNAGIHAARRDWKNGGTCWKNAVFFLKRRLQQIGVLERNQDGS